MTITRIFCAEIDTESVLSLIEELEPILDRGDCVKLYFSSQGGSVTAAMILLDFLEDWEESIILIGAHELFSSGFDVFYKYSGEKRLLPMTVGMLHEASAELAMIKLKNPNTPHSIVRQLVEEFNQSELEEIKEKLTPAEVVKYMSGEDVFFSTSRLKEICNL